MIFPLWIFHVNSDVDLLLLVYYLCDLIIAFYLFLASPNKWCQSAGYKMASVIKFDILKFNGKTSFNIWKVQMMAVLIWNCLKKALAGKKRNMSP